MIKVSIIIVNFNSDEYLNKCIETILLQTYQEFEVLVIDNSSHDNSSSSIVNNDKIRIIKNSRNLGFAKAQNQGFKIAQGEYIMPLNFDILLEPTLLEEMIAALEISPDIGSVSPKLFRMNKEFCKSTTIDNAGLLLPPSRFPIHRGGGTRDSSKFESGDFVFGAMGATALYRREMLDDIAFNGQYYDENYFMWFEDIDLEWRARLRGWKCIYAPKAVAYHIGDPHGHGKSLFGLKISMRNRWMMILSNECIHCFVHNLLPLVKYEVELFVFTFRYGYLKAYLGAFFSVIKSLPKTIEKRRWVRSRATVKCLQEYPQLLQES